MILNLSFIVLYTKTLSDHCYVDTNADNYMK